MISVGIFLILGALSYVSPHGYISDPMSRNTRFWLEDPTPDGPNYDLNGLWCDNILQLPHVPPSTCGVCGDGASGPQNHKLGGRWGEGVIAKTYTSGTLIEVEVNITAPHWGYYEMQLCDNDEESDECFKAHPLMFEHGSYRTEVPYDSPGVFVSREKLQLPPGVSCNRCTLRWTYRTAYTGTPNWNPRYDPNPAQTFRNCADIAILPPNK